MHTEGAETQKNHAFVHRCIFFTFIVRTGTTSTSRVFPRPSGTRRRTCTNKGCSSVNEAQAWATQELKGIQDVSFFFFF